MKKIILSIIITLLRIISVNAQYYVGGSLGFKSVSRHVMQSDNTENPSITTLNTGFDLGLSTENLFPSLGIIYKL